MSRLGHALTELESPPVKALFVYNSNPAAIAPNQNAVVRGMMRSDLFTVVHEQFFTDTTDYADIVLPATTFLEHKDIQGAYGHYFLQLSEPAIAPLGEARSNVWLFSQLAQRMGFTEPCFRDSVDDLIDQALDTPSMKRHAPGTGGEKAHSNTARGGTAVCQGWLCHTQRQGGVLFERAGSAGTRTAAYVSPSRRIAPGGRIRAHFPLEFLPRKADNYMNSTFANLPGHRKMESPGLVMMHASDAGARQIHEADWVEIYNARGKFRLRARIDGSVPAGVVAASLNWNKLSTGGNNVNALTSERLTDLGRGATFYSTLVEVRKLTPDEAQNLFPPID